MTCQHCQTWISDEDHRCSRCGRRVRNTPQRISPSTYPIAASATAHAYDFSVMPMPAPEPAVPSEQLRDRVEESGQQVLFAQPLVDKRVIPFDSLTSAAERKSIRARAAEITRPSPVKAAKAELPRPKAAGKRLVHDGQGRFEFLGPNEITAAPQPSIICDAPVASPSVRLRAAGIDGCAMAAGCLVVAAMFRFAGGQIPLDKHLLPVYLAVIATVPLLHKLLWAFAGRDTPGMRAVNLRLIDFDGNPPSQERRYYRAFGSILSLLAAGTGLVWAFVDEDRLTWQDHISGTFPCSE